jgi:iduronate 2-sulfatase
MHGVIDRCSFHPLYGTAGDHGYALGDNAEFAKQTNFEHATHIPFMISVPGLAPGISHALVEEVDLFPTLVAAATMNSPNGPLNIALCPASTQASRATALCTEGRSLLPLLHNTSAAWPYAAFSQFTRGSDCCDCPAGTSAACCECTEHPPHEMPSARFAVTAGPEDHEDPIMGYSVRVDKWRYTAWVTFNATAAAPNFDRVVATELYEHPESPLPVDWSVEHTNVVHESQLASIVAQLHTVVTKCGQRPDQCPPELLRGLV